MCVTNRPWSKTLADAEADIVGGHDFANLIPPRVKEALLMMREAPLRHNASAAADDAGHAMRGERDEAQQYPGVDGEVIHALLALLDERVAIDLPRQFLGFAVHFLE